MSGAAGLRVLIVEDEPLLALEYESLLQSQGCTAVGVAGDFASAVRAACAENPELALVDLNLRDGLTGLKVARALTQQGTFVLFITSEGQLAMLDHSLLIGCLPKPFTSGMFNDSLSFAAAVVRAKEGGVAVAPPAGLMVAGPYRTC